MSGPLWQKLYRSWWPLVLLLVFSGALIGSAMTRTSATFDEIVMIAGGARGYETGGWDLAPEHPPLVQYLYGLPVWFAHPTLPVEQAAPARGGAMVYRYIYARQFFWTEGNDPERLLLLGRTPAVLCALGLVLLAYLIGRRSGGRAVGLLAALLVAFLPDVLAHGGVAYNDVPLALAYLTAVWLLDGFVRRPNLARAIACGVACGAALAVKNSAVALFPVALALLVAEALTRPADRKWLIRAGAGSLAAAAAVYLSLVLVYRGDFTLGEYRYGLSFVFAQVTSRPSVSYLLGNVSLGVWYFFPLAFLYKTSAAFHVLMLIAVVASLRRRPGLQQLLQSRLRAPALGVLVYGALLLTARQQVGFRYALPVLPLLALLTAAGVVRAWTTAKPWLRRAIVVACAWAVLHPLTFYPYFLSYISEYGPGRARNYQVLVDSSLDWGQGLLALRDWMRHKQVGRVYLSYFGSAVPSGYGIDYVPLPSFYPLPALTRADGDTIAPRWAAISATNLSGTYLLGDPFRRFRQVMPYRILARSIYLYDLEEMAP